MESKFIEIRDKYTRIDVIATKLSPSNDIEKSYLNHNGFSQNGEIPMVSLFRLDNNKLSISPFDWNNVPDYWVLESRTMYEAHRYINEHFDDIPNYWVLDVETVLGEKVGEMKVPERYHNEDFIEFRLNNKIEVSHAHTVKGIFENYYGLEVKELKIINFNTVNYVISKDSISKIDLKFYEVLNEYLVCI